MIVDSFPKITVVHGKFIPSKLKHIKLFSGSKCCNDYTDPTCFLLYDDGSLYRGECKDDLPHGYGWMVYDKSPYSDLSKFVGNWTYGKKHGQGQQYFNNHSVFYGNFLENEIHGTGLMLVDNKFCSNVTYKSGVVESYGKKIENLTYCHYEVLGKGRVNDETKVIKYNVDHCLELKGKYCNKESIYTGSVNQKLEKFGKGHLNFKNGGQYYGDFKYDQMHGEGVTKINHDLFTSGYMSFDKLSGGIQLHTNLTVIANEKLPGKVYLLYFRLWELYILFFTFLEIIYE